MNNWIEFFSKNIYLITLLATYLIFCKGQTWLEAFSAPYRNEMLLFLYVFICTCICNQTDAHSIKGEVQAISVTSLLLLHSFGEIFVTAASVRAWEPDCDFWFWFSENWGHPVEDINELPSNIFLRGNESNEEWNCP